MWLLTKRAIQEIKENWVIKDLEGNINSITWGNIVIEFDESSMSDFDETYVHLFEKWITNLLFEPLLNAIKNIAKDDLWKDAIKDWISKVIITHDKSNSRTPGFDLNGWVLTISHDIISNIDNSSKIDEINSEIEKYLLSNL